MDKCHLHMACSFYPLNFPILLPGLMGPKLTHTLKIDVLPGYSIHLLALKLISWKYPNFSRVCRIRTLSEHRAKAKLTCQIHDQTAQH